MSDTDAGDDGFDKEAEREKLREKYEADEQRREATQQMSELLLKGATMTNQHCDDCGSPIFRYEGEAFCPTCAGTRDVDEGGAGDDAGQAHDEAGQDQGEASQSKDAASGGSDQPTRGQPPAGGTRDAGAQPRPNAGPAQSAGDEGGHVGGAAPGGEEMDESELEAARERLDERVGSEGSVGGAAEGRPDPPVGDSPVRQGEVPSMAQSRASLRRAIVSLSEQAAQSDDPTRAHDLLKGAREASEALAALEGTTGE